MDVLENQLYLGTVRQETDFGFFVQFGSHKGLLPRANIVDRYTKEHSNLYHSGDLVVFKVDQVDSAKKRCILSTKETDIIEKGLPDWLTYETVFKSKLDETEQALHLYGLNYKFGESIEVEFEDKAACTRDEIENISIPNLPKQITAVCIAPDMTQVYEAKQKAHFIGFHSAGVLLFALSSGEQKVEGMYNHPSKRRFKIHPRFKTRELKLWERLSISLYSKRRKNNIHKQRYDNLLRHRRLY